ncbi:PhzF family phenazine biosynthesis protein [Radiobacillus sp. PE A8.2]|uniref:PhzF family phenazine biosynthesis protein n=1 Tax=Radiobacillus sp. PE A8.2 TaxID=3380349 RepID=UPI00388E7083
MKKLTYYIVDVFAEQKYQGNQLAVFFATENLSTEEMQKIANEMHFSETTFILSKDKQNNGYDVRIFTPESEIPFAGHPTIGTSYVINEAIEKGESDNLLLNLGIGQIAVQIDRRRELIWMTQKSPTFGQTFDHTVIAEILSIKPDDINLDFPIEHVSTGLPAIIVPLNNLKALKQCSINHEKFKAFLENYSSLNILVFCNQTYETGNDLSVRVFVDETGFPEDPATGSANGNLAGYLLQHSYLRQSSLDIRIEQGYEIGRPSLLYMLANKTGHAFSIQIGGKVFPVAKGEWL